MLPVVPQCFYFSVVPPSSSSSAYSFAYTFHREIASSNSSIWPREEFEIRGFADNGELFGVHAERNGRFVGICYAHHYEVSAGKREVEIGGLAVLDDVGRMGVGTLLIQFAIAHIFTFTQPWKENEEVVGYVRRGNDAPHKLLNNLGFEFVEPVKLKAPPAMPSDPDGYVEGDKFRFGVKGLHLLNKAFSLLNGRLPGGTKVAFELGQHTIGDLKQTLQELILQYPLSPPLA